MECAEKILNKTLLLTGATGLIGQAIIKRLHDIPVKIIAVVRNKEKAKNLFGEENDKLKFLVADVTAIAPQNVRADYIIHAASQTSSKTFVNEPVETIITAFVGTKNMLEMARVNPIKGFVYLSTMEVYGSPETDEKIFEEHGSNLDTMNIRASYPESKRICENLCASYVSEYGVPAKVVRLTQTFGPGVRYNDRRVFAEFARCVIENKDIILHTRGETKRNYLYTEDAANAILKVLLNGVIGEAYNAANEETYCSIYEMACMVAEKIAQKKIAVRVKENANLQRMGYAPVLKMNLGTEKLKALGWEPKVRLEEMFERMIDEMKKSH